MYPRCEVAFLGAQVVRLATDNKDLIRGYDQAVRKAQQFADVTERVGQSMSIGVTAPLALLAGAVLSATGDLQSLKLGLEAVATASDSVEKQMERLTQIAKLPGIGFEEAIAGSVRLQAVGFSATGAERSLKAFSNAIALTGGGAAELSSVTTQLGQLSSKGKVLAQDLRPIIEAAPAVGRALREAFGTVDSEQIAALGLSTEQFLGTLLTKLEELPKVQGGLKNAFQNLRDSGKRALGSLAEDEAVSLTDAINNIADGLEHAAKVFAAIDPVTKRVAIGVLAIAAAAGPASFAVSKLANGFALAKAALVVISGLPSRLSASFATLNNTLIATQAGLNFNAATGKFQTASGVFISRGAAMVAAANGSSRAIAALRLATSGLASFILSPAGVVFALTAAATAFAAFKVRAAEAKVKADEFTASLGSMSEFALEIESSNLAGEIARVKREMASLPETVTQVVGLDMATGAAATVRVRNPALEALDKDLTKFEAQALGVQVALDQIKLAASDTDLGNFGAPNASTALDKLGDTVKRLLSIYDSLKERGENVGSVLLSLADQEIALHQIIAAQGDRRTEDLEKALRLSNEIRKVLDDSMPSGNLATSPLNPWSGAGAAGTERAQILMDERAKDLAKSMNLTAMALSEASDVPLAERVKNLADAFSQARDNARSGDGGFGALDKLELKLLKFAGTVGNIVGTIERSVKHPLEGVEHASRAFGAAAARGIEFFATLFNPIALFRSTLDQVARNLAPNFEAALAPLQPVFLELAEAITPIVAAIAGALQPVLEALVPVFEKLGPVVAAIAQVLAPILTALVPLLDVFRIILEALFPVIKGVAIAATYLGQVFFSLSSGLSQALGYLIVGIGKAVDALPFVSGGPIIRAGEALVGIGEAAWKAVGELGKAREEIKDVEIGDALDHVASAADRAASSLSNVPEIFDYALRKRMAALAGASAPIATGGVGSTGGGGVVDTGGTGGARRRPESDPRTIIVQVNNPSAGVSAKTIERDLTERLNQPGMNPLKLAVLQIAEEAAA